MKVKNTFCNQAEQIGRKAPAGGGVVWELYARPSAAGGAEYVSYHSTKDDAMRRANHLQKNLPAVRRYDGELTGWGIFLTWSRGGKEIGAKIAGYYGEITYERLVKDGALFTKNKQIISEDELLTQY